MKPFCMALAATALALAPPALAQDVEISVDRPGLAGYTVIKPAGHAARPWPLVVWANGGCRLDPAPYISTLKAVAAQGFLVIAIGAAAEGETRANAPRGERPQPRTLTERIARITPPASKTGQLTAAIDWAQRSASDPRSDLHGKLATHRVAMMGHSCGGMQALEASLDPRVTTTLVWSSGYWRYGGDLPGIRLSRPMLQQLHAPTLYLTGGASDIAHLSAEGDFFEINHIPIFKATSPAPHALSFAHPQGGIFASAGIAWLRWQLLDDPAAAKQFGGRDCGLCGDPRWTIEKKNIP